MTTEQLLSVSNADRFIELIHQGIENWREAGRVAVMAIQENPNFIDELCEKNPDITPAFVRVFIEIGHGRLHPLLALSDKPGVKRLRKLSYELQEEYSNKKVELLIPADGGGVQVIEADVRSLTSDQADQVFDKDGIRPVDQQRLYIADKAAKKAAPPATVDLPYRVVGSKLIVMAPCQFTRKELARLIAEME